METGAANKGITLVWAKLITLALLLLCNAPVESQTYFKRLPQPEQYNNQLHARFSDGDIVIADSYLEALRNGKGGKIYVSRMDPCGRVEWAISLDKEVEYMELRDVKISSKDELFLYGSIYIGLDERIFLIRLNGNGQLLSFKVFQPETVDHFTYNIDIQNGKILVYGLLLGFNTQKQGFIAVFDEALDFKWGKRFSPFEYNGGAIFTDDLGFMCSSGAYLYRLDPEGNLQWAQRIPAGFQILSAPLAIADGFVFQATHENKVFLFHIRANGELNWIGEMYEGTNQPGDLTVMPGGNILFLYACPDNGLNTVCKVIISQNGKLLSREALQSSASMYPGPIFQSLATNGQLTISVNADPFAGSQAQLQDFLFQFSVLEPLESDCFSWKVLNQGTENTSGFQLIPFDTIVQNTIMRPLDFDKPDVGKSNRLPVGICDDNPQMADQVRDTTVDCDGSWTVGLPDDSYEWEDGFPDSLRRLSLAGTYKAKSSICGNTQEYLYTLEKPVCACKVYLPTAFSPNGDDLNDKLELYSDCFVRGFEVQVFDRWGNLVYSATNTDTVWEGQATSAVSSGVYVIKVQYQLLDADNQEQSGHIFQSITLFK